MQYKTGSVSVVGGSQVVNGVDTTWLTEVAPGDIFTIQDSNVWYQVALVQSETQLSLSAPYAGGSATGLGYAVTRDFTPNYGFPYPVKGDVETAAIVARALTELDAKLAAIVAANGLINP